MRLKNGQLYRKVAFTAFFGFLLYSCVPDDEIVYEYHPTEPPQLGFYGTTPESILYSEEFDPPLLISVVYDSQNLFGSAEQLLDITGDGIADLVFKLKSIHPDTTMLLLDVSIENRPSLVIESLYLGYSLRTTYGNATIDSTTIELNRVSKMSGGFYTENFKSIDSIPGVLWEAYLTQLGCHQSENRDFGPFS